MAIKVLKTNKRQASIANVSYSFGTSASEFFSNMWDILAGSNVETLLVYGTSTTAQINCEAFYSEIVDTLV